MRTRPGRVFVPFRPFAPLQQRRKVFVPFTPPSIGSLQLWLKADAGLRQTIGGAVAVNDGDRVGQWLDQSGKNRHLQQSNGTFRPTLKAGGNGISNMPVVRFDPTVGTILNSSTTLGTVITNTAYTVYMVVRVLGATPSGSASYQNGLWFGDSSGRFGIVTVAGAVGRDVTSGTLRGFHWDTTDWFVNRDISFNTAYGLRQRYESGALYLLRSGLGEASVTAGGPGLLGGVLTMGRSVTNTIYANGDVGEIQVYNGVLTAQQDADIQENLTARWGINW